VGKEKEREIFEKKKIFFFSFGCVGGWGWSPSPRTGFYFPSPIEPIDPPVFSACSRRPLLNAFEGANYSALISAQAGPPKRQRRPSKPGGPASPKAAQRRPQAKPPRKRPWQQALARKAIGNKAAGAEDERPAQKFSAKTRANSSELEGQPAPALEAQRSPAGVTALGGR